MSYAPIAAGPDRRFDITGGLRVGYALSHSYGLADVVRAHHLWQEETGQILGVMITPATVSYGWPENGNVHSDSEPGFIVSGSINPLYQANLTDNEAGFLVFDLAAWLADKLHQTRIYISFLGTCHILEKTDGP